MRSAIDRLLWSLTLAKLSVVCIHDSWHHKRRYNKAVVRDSEDSLGTFGENAGSLSGAGDLSVLRQISEGTGPKDHTWLHANVERWTICSLLNMLQRSRTPGIWSGLGTRGLEPQRADELYLDCKYVRRGISVLCNQEQRSVPIGAITETPS